MPCDCRASRQRRRSASLAQSRHVCDPRTIRNASVQCSVSARSSGAGVVRAGRGTAMPRAARPRRAAASAASASSAACGLRLRRRAGRLEFRDHRIGIDGGRGGRREIAGNMDHLHRHGGRLELCSVKVTVKPASGAGTATEQGVLQPGPSEVVASAPGGIGFELDLDGRRRRFEENPRKTRSSRRGWPRLRQSR